VKEDLNVPLHYLYLNLNLNLNLTRNKMGWFGFVCLVR
jgi:hypothetical protein